MTTSELSTQERCQIVDLTSRVQDIVRKSGVTDGLCVVYVPHTTAGVTINENADPDVKKDMLKKLSDMVPKHEGYYQHDEGNSDSHVKTALVGPSVTLIVNQGRLVLGRWQGIYFCEFDGPRTRTFHVKVINAM